MMYVMCKPYNRLAEAILMIIHKLSFEQKYKKYQSFLAESFQFLEVKFSVYLNRRVFEMVPNMFEPLKFDCTCIPIVVRTCTTIAFFNSCKVEENKNISLVKCSVGGNTGVYFHRCVGAATWHVILSFLLNTPSGTMSLAPRGSP